MNSHHKSRRKKINSPQAFASAFNKRQNANPLSIKFIGIDNDGKFKIQVIHLPKWRIDSVEIKFNHQQRTTLSLGEIKQQIKEFDRK